MGNYTQATKDINQALSLNGTQRMKDNARAIRLLASTANHELPPTFSNYLVKEMEWIDSKIKEDRATRLEYDNHYTNIKERIVFRNLVPLYISHGKPEMATALMGMMQKYENSFTPEAAKYTDRAYGYYSDYTCRLDSMNAETTVAYYNLTDNTGDTFEQYIKNRVYANADFFNEMISTKYICEGQFDEAATYLKKVPQQFIDGQRISFYMAQRSYAVPRWFQRQKAKDEEGFLYTDFAAQAIKYLKTCTQSSLINLRYKATHALAFIPVEPWYATDYDADNNVVIRPLPSSAQYQALEALNRFAKQYPQAIDHYTSRCDILQQFRKAK